MGRWQEFIARAGCVECRCPGKWPVRPMCVSSGRKKYLNLIPKDVLTLNYKTLCGGLGASTGRPVCIKCGRWEAVKT